MTFPLEEGGAGELWAPLLPRAWECLGVCSPVRVAGQGLRRTRRGRIWWSSLCNESTCKRGKAAPSKRKWQKEGHWYLYYIAQSNSRMNFSIICIFKIILPIKECKWYGKYEGEGKILGFVVFKKVLCADHPWGVFMWNQNFYVESRCLHCHTASLKEMKS